MSRKDQWKTSLDAIKTFINAHHKYPSTTSTNPAEKSLAQWWSRQRHLLAKHAAGEKTSLDSNQIDSLQSVMVQNKVLDRDGVWNERYNKLVHRFKGYNKLFDYKSDSTEEQLIMRWWNQQKTFARKYAKNPESPVGGLTQDRFDKVVALLRLLGHEITDSLETQNATNDKE